jgi:phosphatidylinositol glycan class T
MRTLLVDLATPDFSMPYNVIIFTSIVVAHIFRGVAQLLAGRISVKQVA